jgi:hypothetical protein
MPISTSSGKKFFKLAVDLATLDKTFRDMSTAMQKASAQSLNVVGRKANKEIAKDIKKNYNIKAGSISRRVSLRTADGRKPNPRFTIFIKKASRGLFLYSARKSKKGVSVRVKRARKKVRGGFILKSRGDKKEFVARKSRKGGFVDRYTKKGTRYRAAKSEFLYGPSTAMLYKRRKSLYILRAVINKYYQKELDKQFNQQFERRR